MDFHPINLELKPDLKVRDSKDEHGSVWIGLTQNRIETDDYRFSNIQTELTPKPNGSVFLFLVFFRFGFGLNRIHQNLELFHPLEKFVYIEEEEGINFVLPAMWDTLNQILKEKY